MRRRCCPPLSGRIHSVRMISSVSRWRRTSSVGMRRAPRSRAGHTRNPSAWGCRARGARRLLGRGRAPGSRRDGAGRGMAGTRGAARERGRRRLGRVGLPADRCSVEESRARRRGGRPRPLRTSGPARDEFADPDLRARSARPGRSARRAAAGPRRALASSTRRWSRSPPARCRRSSQASSTAR